MNGLEPLPELRWRNFYVSTSQISHFVLYLVQTKVG